MDLTRGAFRLFRAAGVDVYLHWSWFLVAWLQIRLPRQRVPGPGLEGGRVPRALRHRPAARVRPRPRLPIGRRPGRSDRPVAARRRRLRRSAAASRGRPVEHRRRAAGQRRPPPPHALWCMANIRAGTDRTRPVSFLRYAWVNLGLLVFNLIPLYPLDGGQFLQALLWFRRWPLAQPPMRQPRGHGFGGLLFVGLLLPGGFQALAARASSPPSWSSVPWSASSSPHRRALAARPAAPRRMRLPELRDRPAEGPLLGVRALSHALRPVRHARQVPRLRRLVSQSRLSPLPAQQPHRPLVQPAGHRRPGSFFCRGTRHATRSRLSPADRT